MNNSLRTYLLATLLVAVVVAAYDQPASSDNKASPSSSTNNLRRDLFYRSDIRYCLTLNECKARSIELGYDLFYIDDDESYPTKGCYAKNNKAFFSLGTEEEMRSMDMVGEQERIYCAMQLPWVSINQNENDIIDGKEDNDDHDACLTVAACKSKSREMGITSNQFYTELPSVTKGCFTKTSTTGVRKAFFTSGTVQQMKTSDLPGIRQRIWCDKKAPDDNIAPPNPTNRPTPSKEPTMKPTTATSPSSGTVASPPFPVPAFNCPAATDVQCTAPDPNNFDDECPTVGQVCSNGNPGEYCCRDLCPRNYCTAKGAQALTFTAKNNDNSSSSGNNAVGATIGVATWIIMYLFV